MLQKLIARLASGFSLSQHMASKSLPSPLLPAPSEKERITTRLFEIAMGNLVEILKLLSLEQSETEWKDFPSTPEIKRRLTMLSPILQDAKKKDAILEFLGSVYLSAIRDQVSRLYPWKQRYNYLQSQLGPLAIAPDAVISLQEEIARLQAEMSALHRKARGYRVRALKGEGWLAIILLGEVFLLYTTWSLLSPGGAPAMRMMTGFSLSAGVLIANEYFCAAGIGPLYQRLLKRVEKNEEATPHATLSPSSRPVPKMSENTAKIPFWKQRLLRVWEWTRAHLKHIQRWTLKEERLVLFSHLVCNSLIVLLRREWASEEGEKVFLLASVLVLTALSMFCHFLLQKVISSYREVDQLSEAREELRIQAGKLRAKMVILLRSQKQGRSLLPQLADLKTRFSYAQQQACETLLRDPILRDALLLAAYQLVHTDQTPPLVSVFNPAPTPASVPDNGHEPLATSSQPMKGTSKMNVMSLTLWGCLGGAVLLSGCSPTHSPAPTPHGGKSKMSSSSQQGAPKNQGQDWKTQIKNAFLEKKPQKLLIGLYNDTSGSVHFSPSVLNADQEMVCQLEATLQEFVGPCYGEVHTTSPIGKALQEPPYHFEFEVPELMRRKKAAIESQISALRIQLPEIRRKAGISGSPILENLHEMVSRLQNLPQAEEALVDVFAVTDLEETGVGLPTGEEIRHTAEEAQITQMIEKTICSYPPFSKSPRRLVIILSPSNMGEYSGVESERIRSYWRRVFSGLGVQHTEIVFPRAMNTKK